MKLSQLKKNKKAVITNISCEKELKQRFNSFGIIKGTPIMIEETSLDCNTIAILVENTSIAIRVEEANNIEVKEI